MDNEITRDNKKFADIAERLKKQGIHTTYISDVGRDHKTGLSYMKDFDDIDEEEIILHYDNESGYYTVGLLLRDNGYSCFASSSEEDAVKEFINQINMLNEQDEDVEKAD